MSHLEDRPRSPGYDIVVQFPTAAKQRNAEAQAKILETGCTHELCRSSAPLCFQRLRRRRLPKGFRCVFVRQTKRTVAQAINTMHPTDTKTTEPATRVPIIRQLSHNDHCMTVNVQQNRHPAAAASFRNQHIQTSKLMLLKRELLKRERGRAAAVNSATTAGHRSENPPPLTRREKMGSGTPLRQEVLYRGVQKLAKVHQAKGFLRVSGQSRGDHLDQLGLEDRWICLGDLHSDGEREKRGTMWYF